MSDREMMEETEKEEVWKSFPIDPATGYAVDPNTGDMVDPVTGAAVRRQYGGTVSSDADGVCTTGSGSAAG